MIGKMLIGLFGITILLLAGRFFFIILMQLKGKTVLNLRRVFNDLMVLLLGTAKGTRISTQSLFMMALHLIDSLEYVGLALSLQLFTVGLMLRFYLGQHPFQIIDFLLENIIFSASEKILLIQGIELSV
jgi:hypothetical protein